MALLKLKDIGKIYVSEGNVAVGIRGVNLSFDRGEFVAVTGQSGSGKSTLLNVISGMDSYEEGEMYIEGAPTSHYMQSDWEEYRKQYISFIFQDYNIIDSFTVLQNVELALMHIEDKTERRERAMELIRRVGLESHIKHKGSKLSGGQKQRTVIARALAKDSPIILADEPTGNLDSATSAEIIELLREVSRDKLLIVVTHNFEQLEAHATRHVRIFDGAVESDHVISRSDVDTAKEKKEEKPPKKHADFKNGITLGRSIFTSRPKLSVFLCLLLIVGTLGIFFVTSLTGEANTMFEDNYMFTPIEGRVVLTRQDGMPISAEELALLAQKHGATDSLQIDSLLDNSNSFNFQREGVKKRLWFDCSFGETFDGKIIGDYPKEDNEVFLTLPISYKPDFGTDAGALGYIYGGGMKLKITGIKYYVDNNIKPKCVFTREGFELATAVNYTRNSEVTVNVSTPRNPSYRTMSYYELLPSFELEKGKIYIDELAKGEYFDIRDASFTATLTSRHFKDEMYYYDDYYGGTISDGSNQIKYTFDDADILREFDGSMRIGNNYYTAHMAVNPYTLKEIAYGYLEGNYTQSSLFFENGKQAEEAIEALRDSGYIAVSSLETYERDAYEALEIVITSVMFLLIWILAIVFLAFFIYLCSSRTIGAFKGDVAIMRSMGIAVKSIRVGMYVRMFIALIPAYITVAAVAILVFTVPSFNSFFTYLYAWQYVMIAVGMLILTARVTQKQIKKLFGQSVKKALRGGATND